LVVVRAIFCVLPPKPFLEPRKGRYSDGGTNVRYAPPSMPAPIGRRVRDRSADERYAHDLDAICSSARIPRRVSSTSCNPNNPTGSLTRKPTSNLGSPDCPAGVSVLVTRPITSLVPRVYVHVVGWARGFRSAPHRYATLFPGLRNAGLRVGYAVAFPETSKLLAQRRLAMGVNIVAARAAAPPLADQAYLKKIVDRVTDDRQEVYNQANARMLRSLDSVTKLRDVENYATRKGSRRRTQG